MSVARTLLKLQAYIAASADSLSYENEATTGTTVQAALDWILASLYPNTQDSVDTVGELPLVGNTINDYRVVLDDGDGLAAGYRWEQREGDAAPSWYKIHDMDWSSDAILTAFSDIAHELYVHKQGRTDTDDSGNPITGTYAGQTIYGGSASGQNLTLNANSGDGTGAQSGYIQFDGHTRPTSDNAFDLGTITERFRDLLVAGDLSDGTDSFTIAEGKAAYDHSQITDGSNPHATSYDSLSSQLGTLTVDGDASGSVDLSSSGAKTLTLTVADNSHNHTAANVTDFDAASYTKTKAIIQDGTGITWTANDGLETLTPAIEISTAQITDVASPAANKILAGSSDGSAWVTNDGVIELTGDVTGAASYSSTTGQWSIATTVVTTPLPFTLENKTFTSAAGNPSIITATAHGLVSGETARVIGGLIPDAEYTVTVTDANTFTIPFETLSPDTGYYIPQGAQLLYNTSTDQFQIAKEFEEISHSELANLTGDDHTQYVAKDGRAGGQTIKGGISASQNLTLQSTDHATRGVVQTNDDLVPTDTAAYSGGWSGTDLGSSTQKWNDIYMAGELKGARVENVGALPSNSGTTVGRMVFFDGAPYWDTGSEWVAGGGGGPLVVTSKVANYTAVDGDQLIICNGTFTVSLPDCASLDTGYVYRIKNVGTGVISIDPHSTQTIDGETLVDIVDQYASLTICSDGLNWHII